MPNDIVFRNATVFDGDSEQLHPDSSVVVAGGMIRSVGRAPVSVAAGALEVDCAGRILMPGLIDAHVHVYASTLNINRVVQTPLSYLAHFAANFLRSSLGRGFTTVRDVGGADVGLASAIKDGLLTDVPRLFYGGRVLTQTGGHGDFRPGDHALDDHCGCACIANSLAVVADGPDELRRAIREELRRGASHVKIMASGGVASPTDPLDRSQYSDEEIRTAVEEAHRAGSYVVAHCHPAEAVQRAAKLGVRSIEHATLIDQDTAAIVAERDAFVVPTIVTIIALRDEGERLGFPPASVEKLRRVSDRALSSLEVMKRAGVKMGFGTDLLGPLHEQQSTEFTLRGQVLSPIEVLRSACTINAEILGQVGRLGVVREGAYADLLVVEGNPLDDLSVLASGSNLAVIMKDGKFYKRTI